MLYLIPILIFAALVVFAWWVGRFFYNFGINSKTDKSALFAPEPARPAAVQARLDASHKQDEAFLAAHPAEELHLMPSHGKAVQLRAQVFRQAQPSSRWAVVVHGYGSEGQNMLREVRGFYRGGCNVLLPDLRGHGKSAGDYIGMGWHDHYDILDWLKLLTTQEPDCEILLYGVSMGAATVMNVTGEAVPANLKVAIEDCGYTSIRDIFGYHLKRLFKLPVFPTLYLADLTIRLRAGYSVLTPGPLQQVAKSKTPTLFIHGDRDTFVPFFMLDQLYAAAACPKQRLVIPGAEHAKAEFTDPARYWQTVWSFAKQQINSDKADHNAACL